VLVHFDLDKSFWLETDSSSFAIAGILSQLVDQARSKAPKKALTLGKKVKQDWHPVAFWLRTMAPTERNYIAGDQEMLAIVVRVPRGGTLEKTV
jgi:hypothetical protein